MNEWFEDGGALIIGYEMYRNLVNHRFVRSKKMKEAITKYLVDPGIIYSGFFFFFALCVFNVYLCIHCLYYYYLYADLIYLIKKNSPLFLIISFQWVKWVGEQSITRNNHFHSLSNNFFKDSGRNNVFSIDRLSTYIYIINITGESSYEK